LTFERFENVESAALLGADSDPARSLGPIAPPVSGLNVVRVIISPSPAHASRVDMVRYDVAVIRELGTADATLTSLGHDLSIEQLSHLSVRAELTVPSRMKWIFNSA
jgi:hypothetical protein